MQSDDTPIPETPNPAPGRKVLCIEDEHFISELYARSLTKGGYEVTVIPDGAKALIEAQTDKYDIILLDLMVPNVTGIEILRALRDTTQTPQLKAKIIITTNLDQRDDVREDIENNADAYLVKAELTPHELVNFVNTVQ
ncbi:MAG: Response regulator receiver protein [Candidatus Saccharibacteria bacterium]|nr:Response regulator receiver protein [Candidatus Saccharibacteria bacterium]